jgi:hypothetical protein
MNAFPTFLEVHDSLFHHIGCGSPPMKMFQKSIQTAVCMPSISTWVNLSVPVNVKVLLLHVILGVCFHLDSNGRGRSLSRLLCDHVFLPYTLTHKFCILTYFHHLQLCIHSWGLLLFSHDILSGFFIFMHTLSITSEWILSIMKILVWGIVYTVLWTT